MVPLNACELGQISKLLGPLIDLLNQDSFSLLPSDGIFVPLGNAVDLIRTLHFSSSLPVRMVELQVEVIFWGFQESCSEGIHSFRKCVLF